MDEDEIQRTLVEIRKGQQLAGHEPSPEALALAERVLRGEVTVEQARADLIRKHKHQG